ncbi:formylglycine-generating enzyme family protein [Nocardia fusca]|uniref:formylglycine-generating enzyme family protein n=1 Tax=Nocardia fusca TaxID=941183 RepID=UPI0037CA73F5
MKYCCTPTLHGNASADGPPVASPQPRRARGSLIAISTGNFSMGDHFQEGYPQDGELPVHRVSLSAFAIAAHTVTNAQFAAFVKDTGYVTDAEKLGISAVFHPAFRGDQADIMHRVDGTPWWLAVRGANWRHPDGPASGIADRRNHPVVHVSWHDAAAYCSWAGVRLPSEAEWEYAARGGVAGKRFVWGDELTPRGQWRCNIWQGRFPYENLEEDGYLTTAPVKSYRPNGYGLWQMTGNVWEWCHDWFAADYYAKSAHHDPAGPATGTRRVMRGGSYLCHASYCHRYRVSARSSNTPESTAGNIGFRCAADPTVPE